ncbi:hypothetical protein, partial [Undibacterium griseum]|uniref:hypothetical protein n=1 Tax=Undibacterium griseum TaxID=2762295 RepID=UPI001C9B30AA
PLPECCRSPETRNPKTCSAQTGRGQCRAGQSKPSSEGEAGLENCQVRSRVRVLDGCIFDISDQWMIMGDERYLANKKIY